MSGKIKMTPLLTAILTLVFSVSLPAFAASEKVLYSFKNNGEDGNSPYSALTFDAVGNLYGTTLQGGAYAKGCSGLGCGTVFRLVKGTSGHWTESVLHSFTGGTDGGDPTGTLIFDISGNIYGTTQAGGVYGYGTVFELQPVGNDQWAETVLHSFNADGIDGVLPYAGLISDNLGNLYGTTAGGGQGHGTIFELSNISGGTWAENILYAFGTQNSDGGTPYASLTFDSAGNLYGSVSKAGVRGGDAIALVFELTPGSGGTWSEKMLYGCKLQGCPNQGIGAHGSVVIDPSGRIYSTTFQGGAYGQGVVFELAQGNGKGGKWKEKVIHSFGNGNDGQVPQAGLVRDVAGHLYGTTEYGGYYGTAFRLTHGTNGVWAEKILHVFGKGKDGADIHAGLIVDSGGHLFGTTSLGGAHGVGTVFELMP